MHHARTFRSLLSWQIRRRLASGRSARSGSLSQSRARQCGWVGIIVLLIALVIVAVLAQTVLKSYGMLRADAPAKAQTRVPGPAAPAEPDTASTPAAPTTPIERARGVEQMLKQGAEDRSKRIDDQTK